MFCSVQHVSCSLQRNADDRHYLVTCKNEKKFPASKSKFLARSEVSILNCHIFTAGKRGGYAIKTPG